jgi:hypothetical protein
LLVVVAIIVLISILPPSLAAAYAKETVCRSNMPAGLATTYYAGDNGDVAIPARHDVYGNGPVNAPFQQYQVTVSF